MINNQEQNPKDQLPIDEFSGTTTEITYTPPEDAPDQAEVTLAPESVFEGGKGEDKPLVGKPEEELEAPKPEAKPKAPEPKPEEKPEEKIDFVKVMRDNDLEIFTKELFTSDVPDEEFSTQLINDKYLGQQSYVEEIDYNTFEYYPKEAEEKIETLKQDIGRAVANLTPEERKTMATVKGGDELVLNKYMVMANERFTATVALGAATALVAVPAAVGAAATATAMAAGAGTAILALYTGAEIANAIDRAQRDSPEELEAMKKTKENKPYIIPALEKAEEYGFTPRVREFINEMTERDLQDNDAEKYVKEFSQMMLDSASGAGIGKLFGFGVKAANKGGKAVAKAVSEKISPDVDAMNKLAELIEVQKAIKADNKRVKIAKTVFADVDAQYAHIPPPLPTAENAIVDFNALAGEAIDKVIRSGGNDLKAVEDFRINNVRGSNYQLNTKLVNELPKDAAEAQLKAKPSSQTYGKGDEGGGTTIMKFVEKYDQLGALRKTAIDRGDTQLNLRLSTLQEDIGHRIQIELTQNATKMQEINRSMPLRRDMKALQDEYALNASDMKQNGLVARERKRLDERQQRIEKDLARMQTALTDATSSELVTMAVANTIHSNMLGQHAVINAAIGGMISTVTNSTLLLQKGLNVSQIFKMQAYNLGRLQNDFRKFDFKQLRSDAVQGKVNSRLSAKNVADVTIKETDNIGRKAIKTGAKGVNIVAAPIQLGLGTVDFVMDRFNRTSRVTEMWYDYAKKQQKAGRTSDDLVKELNEIIDNPEALSRNTEFYSEVIQKAEIGLATDKMMLKTNHPAGFTISKPLWAVDGLLNKKSGYPSLDMALQFVNPYSKTAASVLDSIAENSAIGMFRKVGANEKFASLTARQINGTVGAMAAAYGLSDRITHVPKGSEKTAGAFGFRSGMQVGGHQFPLARLNIYGEIIERYNILVETIDSMTLEGVDASKIGNILGGLIEVVSVTGAVENFKQISQEILSIREGLSKVEVSKMIEKFAPAGYILKGVSDVGHGSLAADPYLMQVFSEMDTEYGNAKRRTAFGTPISEGENQELDRGPVWLLNRKGENSPEIKLNRMLIHSGVYQQGPLASFKTEYGTVPHSRIMVDGNYTPLELRMTPLQGSVKIGGSKPFAISMATKNKALGVMSLRKETMTNILDQELTNLSYLDPISKEGQFLRNTAIRSLRSLKANISDSMQKLEQDGVNKPLPEVLISMLSKDAPNVTESFDEKSHSIDNLMKFNPSLFGGNESKQRKFFTQVHRTKDTVLFYNYMKQTGMQFMQNSAEAISTEIKRIEGLQAR